MSIFEVVKKNTSMRVTIGPGQYIKLQNVQCYRAPDGTVYCIVKGDQKALERILQN